MEDKKFKKWIPHDNVDSVYDLKTIEWRNDGWVLSLLPDNFDQVRRSEHVLEMIWSDVLCYKVTKETYRPDLWISNPNDAWTFYVSQSSRFLELFRENNDLVPELVYHFIVNGTNFVIDILSMEYPEIVFAKKND